MDRLILRDEIVKLKKERNAIVLAHLYQSPEVQAIADITGDSLELAINAAKTDADVIVLCGVWFMAETAKIISPQKKVLIPRLDAGCPMADMVDAAKVLSLRQAHPEAAVVCYVNSSAEVKSHSDYCCTSSNAVELVRHIPNRDIIFIPDRNLGSYIAGKLPEKNVILIEGFCPVHEMLEETEVLKLRHDYPDYEIMAHPECRPGVLELADYIGSTAQMMRRVAASDAKGAIVLTEEGIYDRLVVQNPNKEIIMLREEMLCSNMKKTDLESIYVCLKEIKNEVLLAPEMIEAAGTAIRRMLDFSALSKEG